MNTWIQKSLTLAETSAYVDKLFEIYPIEPNGLRELPENIINELKEAYENKDNNELFELLLSLDKFPIDHSFMGMLEINKEIRDRNPNTIKKLTDMLFSLSFEDMIKLCKAPKSSSRQIGPMFKNWLVSKYEFVSKAQFNTITDRVIFLEGSDTKLKEYINDKFDAGLSSPNFKGIDLVFRKADKFYMGEAKLITRSGGTQSNQFNLALKIADLDIDGLNTMGIIDGVPWFINSFKTKINAHSEKNIMSGLLLTDFISAIEQE